ncbi:MAG: response regulator [Pseudomonadota bacterium]|jgi:two-component system response regulator DctR
MNPIIHIVDDDPDFRDALAWLLDSRGLPTQTWSGGDVFLQALGAGAAGAGWPPAVVLLDIRMAPVSGLSTFEQLKALNCPWPVLFITGHGDVGMAVAAVKDGAWDFLEKPFQNNVLVDKVEAALAAVQSDESRQAQQLREALAQLSQREREVLDELLAGHYNKNIAEHLGITPRTVEFHRANLFAKMGVASAVELAHLLGRHGLR